MECDLVVIGSGPGGYPAAIRAAQLGASVVVVEEATQVGGESAVVGGTCLNVGCIPTKAMVQSAHAYNDAQGHFAQLGVRLGNVDLDFEQVQSNRRGIVDGVVKGLAGLLKGNGITVVQGHGRFSGPNTLAVEGGEDITFKSAVIATGSRPAAPPIPGIDHPRCIDSTGALELDAVPQRLAVLGGGVIGVEFASIYAQFGSAVTVVEMLPNLIGNEDADAVAGLQRAFRRRGIAVELGARATGVEETDGNLSLRYETSEGENKLLEADVVLVATECVDFKLVTLVDDEIIILLRGCRNNDRVHQRRAADPRDDPCQHGLAAQVCQHFSAKPRASHARLDNGNHIHWV